ncbi:hypothetical protein RJZ56_002325 [Blastomyces dermatitidis]
MSKDGVASVEIAEAEEEVDEVIPEGEEPAVVLEVIEVEARVVVVVEVEEEGMECLVGSKPSRSSRKMAPHLAKVQLFNTLTMSIATLKTKIPKS